MFNYDLKTRIIIISVFLALLATVIMWLRFDGSRANDLELVSNAKNFAEDIERYYDKFNAYPVANDARVNNIRYITENGINKDGVIVYYTRGNKWSDNVRYSSDSNNYSLIFDLNNSWKIWSLEGGGRCVISANVTMNCTN